MKKETKRYSLDESVMEEVRELLPSLEEFIADYGDRESFGLDEARALLPEAKRLFKKAKRLNGAAFKVRKTMRKDLLDGPMDALFARFSEDMKLAGGCPVQARNLLRKGFSIWRGTFVHDLWRYLRLRFHPSKDDGLDDPLALGFLPWGAYIFPAFAYLMNTREGEPFTTACKRFVDGCEECDKSYGKTWDAIDARYYELRRGMEPLPERHAVIYKIFKKLKKSI